MAAMKIVLTTLHAKYAHNSLALPCLAAASAEITGVTTVIREYTINEHHATLLRALMAEDAAVIAFSCYIWNVESIVRLAVDLKRLNPALTLLAGGPEVSHTAQDFLNEHGVFDGVLRGEGEQTWRELVELLQRCHPHGPHVSDLPDGLTWRTPDGIVETAPRPPLTDLDLLSSPFARGLADLNKPLVYFETSRGCPFTCAFCMSALEQGVRTFSLERIHRDLQLLMAAGVQTVKLVDRTFNYDARRADAIWEMILSLDSPSRFHFEIAADLLTDDNFRTLARVPEGRFRFEIGVQATGRETLARVARQSDTVRLFANVRRLLRETAVTVHLDLVAGLPGEDFQGFLDSLEQLLTIRPHHIQVEPLKVLKGSPMTAIAHSEGYVWSPNAPYVILRTPLLSYGEICCIEDISRQLDLIYNSGRFPNTLTAVAGQRELAVFFRDMARQAVREQTPAQSSVRGLFEQFWTFVRESLSPTAAEDVRDALCFDYCRGEYPSTGLIPSFFPRDWQIPGTSLDRKQRELILAAIAPPPGSRVRTYEGTFAKDYTTSPPGPGPARVLFVSVAAAGAGLQVTPVRIQEP